jgi:hypothetical protein
LGIVSLWGWAFFIVRQKNKHNEELQEKNKTINEQNEELKTNW